MRLSRRQHSSGQISRDVTDIYRPGRATSEELRGRVQGSWLRNRSRTRRSAATIESRWNLQRNSRGPESTFRAEPLPLVAHHIVAEVARLHDDIVRHGQ